MAVARHLKDPAHGSLAVDTREVRSKIGEGTTVTIRIPLRTRFEVVGRSLETMAPGDWSNDAALGGFGSGLSKTDENGDIFPDNPIVMNNLGPLFVCAAALNFAVGCSNPYSAHPLSDDQPVSSKPAPYEPKKTQIISEPPGARIEINGSYVGDAPITVELAQRGGYFDEDTVVRAIPSEGGDYPQTKRFLTSDPWYHPGFAGDKIPARIFFNMHLGQATPAPD